jgi:hypothetical protein
LRHAQARNVIERIFGVSKKKFLLLAQGSKHDEATQAKFISAMAALFNFIRIHDPMDHDMVDIIPLQQRGAMPVKTECPQDSRKH